VARDVVAELCPLRGEPRRRWSPRQDGSKCDGERSDQRARGGVEEEVIAGGDDNEQHEGWVERSDRTDDVTSTVAEQSGGGDQRVADVHAGHGGVGVVERADEAAVEVDVAAGDGVEDADAGQPRRGGRIDEEADEGESAREQQCGADEREAVGAAPVEPEQHPGRDGEVKGQVGGAEQAREAGEVLDDALHVRLGEEMQRPFERDDSVGVSVGFCGVRADEATCELVDPVQREGAGGLGSERMPHGQLAAGPADDAGPRRADHRGRHAMFLSSSAIG
jgi:hypothetical protein